MNVNPSLITATGRQAAALQAQGRGDAVAAHVGGDWAEHSQVNVFPVPYLDNAGDTVGGYTLRIQATHDASPFPVVAVLAVPMVVTGSTPGAEGAAPILISQSTAVTVTTGGSAELSVTTISGLPSTYQWYRAVTVDGSVIDQAIAGAVYRTLAFTSATASDAGQYRCVISNVYGSVASDYATLTVA